MLASIVAAIGVCGALQSIGTSGALALPGPSTLPAGFVDDTLFYSGQESVWFPRMRQLDSTWMRIPAYWNAIEPSNPSGFNAANPADPHYHWTSLDTAVRDAAASHQHVLLTLESPPNWALGPGAPGSASPQTWRPNAHAYGTFARAVADRYSGHFPDPSHPGRALPRVSNFQAWNEPNLSILLEPQWTRTGHGFRPASPAIYRSLLNSLYASVKAVQPHAYVVLAGLAPYGDPPGVDRMRPVAFLRELLCLHGARLRPERCPHPAHFDAIDMHPYALTPTSHAVNVDDVSSVDLGRLSRVLRAAVRSGRALPRRDKPIWETELAWPSSPPASDALPLAKQARYLSLGFYEAWRQGVSHVFWYEVHDLDNPSQSFTSVGLFFQSGAPKPSSVAFHFPFVALRDRGGVVTLWGRAPAGREVTIQVSRHGWRRLLSLRATRGGVFYARRRLGSHLLLRASARTSASGPWATS